MIEIILFTILFFLFFISFIYPTFIEVSMDHRLPKIKSKLWMYLYYVGIMKTIWLKWKIDWSVENCNATFYFVSFLLMAFQLSIFCAFGVYQRVAHSELVVWRISLLNLFLTFIEFNDIFCTVWYNDFLWIWLFGLRLLILSNDFFNQWFLAWIALNNMWKIFLSDHTIWRLLFVLIEYLLFLMFWDHRGNILFCLTYYRLF